MIYVMQSLNIEPAAPSTRDRVVEVMDKYVLPANARLGARLVAGFFAHEEWFSQIVHVTEFDDLGTYERYRQAAASDADAAAGVAQLANLAPIQRTEFLEPLGPIATSVLHDQIAASANEPASVYTFAILEVTAGKLDQFSSMLGAAAGQLPIVACWHDLSGDPNRVIDLWKADTGRPGYRPNDDGQEAFFGPLRQIAPKERMMRLHVMPYSPLR